MDRIAIICSEFNKNLVEQLYQKAIEGFKNPELKAPNNNPPSKKPEDFKNPERPKNPYQLETYWVPGAGEIPLASKWAIEKRQAVGVLGLGVIIRGQTAHFDFLKDFLQNSLWSLQNRYSLPIIFSVLMLENRNQAQDRILRAQSATQALLHILELKKHIEQNKD